MRVLSRVVLVLFGAIALIAGIALLIKPRVVWSSFVSLATWTPAAGPPTAFYVLGVVSLLLGIVLVYTGIRRFTPYSVLILIIGIIALLDGFFILIAPTVFRDFLQTVFFAKPDSTKIILSYIGGVIRIIIGMLFIIAGLSHSYSDNRFQVSPTGVRPS